MRSLPAFSSRPHGTLAQTIYQAVLMKAYQIDFGEPCANLNLPCIATGRTFETIIPIRDTP